jgi:hypothetical protein
MKDLITSNCPLFTVALNKNTAPIIIQQIGKNPYIAPYKADKSAVPNGMPYAKIETASATMAVSKLALYPFIFFIINAQKMNRMGNDATSADIIRFPNGSVSCVYFIPKLVKR